MKNKTMLVISDKHCGHDIGLTPPAWEHKNPGEDDHVMRRTVWDWVEDTLIPIKPDILLVNGDSLDGKGSKSGSTEQIYPDRVHQVEMASEIIDMFKAKNIFMSYGTPFHTGDLEDWEDLIAKNVEADKIGSEDNIEINGKIINYRHHVGRSSIPHGRHTAVAKEALWNLLWAERGEFPKADIIIRSHVHYHAYAGGPDWLAMTTPALQGYGTKFGTRRVSGTVDIGAVVFEFDRHGEFTWQPLILRLGLKVPVSVE